MKTPIYTSLAAGIAVLFCAQVSQANISYYVRNDTAVPLMVGLYSIDENGRVINPDNYTFLLAPQTPASQGQSARLTSLNLPREVDKRFVFSQTPDDMVRKVIYDVDHPWVFVRPLEYDENGAIKRYYHVYSDIFSHEAEGYNLIIEPLEHPIVGNQSKLKFNLRKEDDIRKANLAIRRGIEQNKEAVKEIKEKKKKAVEELKKQLEKKAEISQTRSRLQMFIRSLKEKARALRRPNRPVVAPSAPAHQPYTPQRASAPFFEQEPIDEPLFTSQYDEPVEAAPEVVFHQQSPSLEPVAPSQVVIHQEEELPPLVIRSAFEPPIAERVEPLDVDLQPGPEAQEERAVLAHAQALAAADPENAAKLEPLIKQAEQVERQIVSLMQYRERQHRQRRSSAARDQQADKMNKRRLSVAYRLPEDPDAVREQAIDDFMSGKVDPFKDAGFEEL